MAVTISTASYIVLAVQVLMPAMIGYGTYQMRFKRKLRRHRLIQSAATVLNLVTAAAVMVPSVFSDGVSFTDGAQWCGPADPPRHWAGGHHNDRRDLLRLAAQRHQDQVVLRVGKERPTHNEVH